MLPQLLPQGPGLRLDENPAFPEGVVQERAGKAAPFVSLLSSIEDQVDRHVKSTKRLSEASGLRSPVIEVGLNDDEIQLAIVKSVPPSTWAK
jgi:hypothetical protein